MFDIEPYTDDISESWGGTVMTQSGGIDPEGDMI